MAYLEGTFKKPITPNATFGMTLDCGSHCEEYGVPPDSREGETGYVDFCDMSNIHQSSPGKKGHCPPQEGTALIDTMGYVWDMFVWWPVSPPPPSVVPEVWRISIDQAGYTQAANKDRAIITLPLMLRPLRVRGFIV